MVSVAIYQNVYTPYRHELFKRISKMGVHIRVFIGGTPVGRPFWERPRSNSLLRYDFLQSLRIRSEYVLPVDLTRIRREVQNFDVVIVPFNQLISTYLLLWAKSAGIKSISWNGCHTTYLKLSTMIREPLQRMNVLLSDHFFAYSEAAKEYLMYRGARSSRVTVIPNGVDTQKFSPSIQSHRLREELKLADKKVILYVGRLSKEKGVEYLIKSLSHVERSVEDVHLLVVGVGDQLNILKRMVFDLKLSDKVTFLGSVSYREVNNIYAVSDVCVFPSIITRTFVEPFANVWLEAMASGKPMIAFNIPGPVTEVVVNGQTGFLVPEKDIFALADKINLLLRNDDLRRKMGENARKAALRTYDLNRIAEMWFQALHTGR